MMQIHVVQPGQSLYGISQAYGVSVNEIASANELSISDTLVVGQALVIPIVGMYYWVQPGDSLYSISRKFNLNMNHLAQMMNMSLDQQLMIGTRIYIPPAPKVSIESNAYIEPRGTAVTPQLQQDAREAVPLLTYLAPFSFQIKRDGTLTPPLLDDFSTIAQSQNTILMMVVTNLENDQFSAELGSVFLNNQAIQDKLLNNIIQTAKNLNFKDIHFDIEHISPADTAAYNQFLRKASRLLHDQGFLMSTALVPKTSRAQEGAWYSAHDYRVHGEVADFVIIMTYEWGYSAGPPMPVSPINSVRDVLNYAITEIPSKKIMMGQNLYGYDWTLPFVRGSSYARAVSPQQAIALARNNNVAIQYDYVAQAPFFHYTGEQGKRHVVWFEDARSIQAKFNLLIQLNLRGISYWKLGLDFPQNWLLLSDRFRIIKR